LLSKLAKMSNINVDPTATELRKEICQPKVNQFWS